jgi:hypothetical protein
MATLLLALYPGQSWATARLVTGATSTVGAVATAVKPTMSSAATAVAVLVKTPALPATPLTPSAPVVSVKAPSVPAVSVQVTAPAVSVKAGPSGVSVKATVPAVTVSATAPAVSVNATVPPVSVKATAPAVSVKATAPAVSVKTTAPAVSVKASTPAVTVKAAHAPSGTVSTSVPGISVKTSTAPRTGAAVSAPVVAVAQAGVSPAGSPRGASSRRGNASAAPAGKGHDALGASASAAVLSDGSATLEDPLATSFGQQTFSGYANSSAGALPGRGAEGTVARQRLLEHQARALVQRLAGCLATLPHRERLLLELLSGVDVPHALTLDQVAAALHIRSAKVPRLERAALARLRALARTTACAGTAQSVPTIELASYTLAAVPGSVEAASGGVKAARYAKAPSGGSTSSKRQSGLALGSIPASHPDALLLLIAILGATLAIVALSVDAVGAGPRHRRWRARWLAGTRQAWRRKRRR